MVSSIIFRRKILKEGGAIFNGKYAKQSALGLGAFLKVYFPF
jgi:hypothetical protein